MGRVEQSDAEVIAAIARPVLRALAGPRPLLQAQVDDLCQQVVEKMTVRIEAGPPIRNLETYTKQVARRAYFTAAKRLRREEARSLSGGSSLPPELAERYLFQPVVASPSTLVADQDDQRRYQQIINDAMASLGDSEAEVLRLRYDEGLSSAEVADLLGYKSAASVDSITSRARGKLEVYLLMVSPSLIGIVLPGK